MTRKEREHNDELEAQSLSMVKTFAYHCKRCNYVWIPKDYDYGGPDNDNPKTIAKVSLPKSCARCKSKYWRQERVNRPAVSMSIPLGPLYDWVKKVVKMGRKEGYDDRKIASLIVAYGHKGNYSNSQISEVLRYNGVKRYSRHS